MKNLCIVANWKENKTAAESIGWLREISNQISPPLGEVSLASLRSPAPDGAGQSGPLADNKKIIVCPPFISLAAFSEFIKSNNIKIELGVQDVSKFPEGAHTGEVSAREAAEFVKFAIIGHSERRANGETDEDVKKKVEEALKYSVEPIVCVVSENIPVPQGVKIVAYEPVEAIGTGAPDTPDNAERVASDIKSKHTHVLQVLYGGSVNPDNVKNFTNMEHLDGILVGGASLNPQEFSSIIKQC